MLHAVKYLLIAMQFPQVHKERLYDDDVELLADGTWIELSSRASKSPDHQFACYWVLALNIFIFKVKLHFHPSNH